MKHNLRCCALIWLVALVFAGIVQEDCTVTTINQSILDVARILVDDPSYAVSVKREVEKKDGDADKSTLSAFENHQYNASNHTIVDSEGRIR
ncbi:unnamed protein product [Anisakis simplex]|uniref:Uncharacterized protein n=1 Tax=Anisakis simplex TaxID=6269 RepID=A0A0M3J8G7_ANISI|nr:unnamed protein product [Anisakis simplex]VDK40038.1 unnamed protein product [Anisakis simplex]